MHLFYTPNITFPAYQLTEEESRHAIKVLRMQTGDNLVLIDGKGGWHQAEILDPHPKHCTVKITSSITEKGKRNFKIHVVMAPTKMADRMEWFLEKATEIGIDEVTFIETSRTERSVVKTERLNKIIESAMKQSLKAYHPVLNELITFKGFIKSFSSQNKQCFIAHCLPESKQHLKHQLTQGGEVVLLIGPEGDFTPEEIEIAISAGFKPCSLGDARLRTETAALYVVTCINLLNEM